MNVLTKTDNLVNDYSKFELLVDGKQAFPEIINCINHASKSVVINMFIWRADNVGLQIATAVLNAANRGVKVEISVDRYGFILEMAEESTLSFFHQKPSLKERVSAFVLTKFYGTKKVEFCNEEQTVKLRDLLLNHPNVKVERNKFKADHSKYYLIDDSLLIMGGINIEDKENGADYLGRVYQDYMVKITDNRVIGGFLSKIKGEKTSFEPPFFGVNLKAINPPVFEMKNLYLEIIKQAKQNLYITMAYFAPDKQIVDEIVNACKRGVKTVITLPKSANFQNDANLKTAKLLLQKTNAQIDVYLSPKMVHTKFVANEAVVSFGSTNINKKAFKQLDELNLFVENKDCKFVSNLFNSVFENISLSEKVDKNDIKYSKVRAFIEGILM